MEAHWRVTVGFFLLVIAASAALQSHAEEGSPIAGWLAENYLPSLSFEITEIELNPYSHSAGDEITGWVSVTNTGDECVNVSGWFIELVPVNASVPLYSPPIGSGTEVEAGDTIRVPLGEPLFDSLDAVRLIGVISWEGIPMEFRTVAQATAAGSSCETFADEYSDCRTWKIQSGGTWELGCQVADDMTPPIIEQPQQLAFSAPSCAGSVQVNYEPPRVYDDCPGVTLSRIEGKGPGSYFPVGVTTETYVARDLAGNETVLSFDISVGKTPCVLSIALVQAQELIRPTKWLDIPKWAFELQVGELSVRCDSVENVGTSRSRLPEFDTLEETVTLYVRVIEDDLLEDDAGAETIQITTDGPRFETKPVRVEVRGQVDSERAVWELSLEIRRR